MITLENKIVLLFIALLLIFFIFKNRYLNRIEFNFSVLPWPSKQKPHTPLFLQLSNALFVLALVVLLVAIGNPQYTALKKIFAKNDANVMFLLDISPSMSIVDMETQGNNPESRIEAAKKNIKHFIAEHENIAIGMTVFASQASLLIPTTLDHSIVLKRLDSIAVGELGEGTAQGDGLATAMLHTGKNARSFLVLLTDGENNAGMISPLTVAELIAKKNIDFYILGVGNDGTKQIQYTDPKTNKTVTALGKGGFNEKELRTLAATAGGTYENVNSAAALNEKLNIVSTSIKKNIVKETSIKSFSIRYETIMLCCCLFAASFILKKILFRVAL